MPTPVTLLAEYEENHSPANDRKPADVIELYSPKPEFSIERLGNFLYRLHSDCVRLSGGQSIFYGYSGKEKK